MEDYKKIILRPQKEDSIKRFHPWVFSGAIAQKEEITEGEHVHLFSHNGDFLGVGHYQIGSSIAVRILSFEKEEIGIDFYRKRLAAALVMRESIGLLSQKNNIFRLVHGEGDSLPGLIVDIYGNTAVIQVYSSGMQRDKMLVLGALRQVLGASALHNVFYKPEVGLPFKANSKSQCAYLWGGQNVESIALENGLKFYIDWQRGQKTGFFIDRRESRALLERYAEGKKVLNMFAYTGGFSLYALRGGAQSVLSVDSSAKAMMLTDKNVQLNFGNDARHHSFSEDAFKFLKQAEKDAYDLMVIDPPAFARHRGAIRNALQGYRKLNLAALEKIASGGILFTFSCSQAISGEQFRLAVFSAAAISGRRVRILHQLTQPADHPINIYHPEGAFLKGFVLFVE